MREFVVSEAPLGRVATLARATVEEAGGVVAQHTETTTEFDHLQEDEDDWSRSGYVGSYKRYREDPVQLRIRVWASWPRRLFHGAVWLGLVEAVLFFTLSMVQVPPPPNVWILSAILTFAFLGVAFLLYATSWADSADLEDEIARKLTARIRDDEEIDGDVYTVGEWEEHRQDVIEQAVVQAERKAPERPSKASQLAGSVAQAGKGKAGALLQRVRSGEDEGDDEDRREADGTDASEDGDPELEEEPGEADEEDVDPELAAKRERLEELKRKKQEEDDADSGLLDRIPFLGSSGDEDAGGEPTDEPEEDAAQAEEPSDGEDNGSSFIDRLPFIGSSDGPDEDAGDATGDEDEAEPETEPATDEADAEDASPEQADAPEPEPADEGDAEAEETEPPATAEDEDVDEER